MIGVRAALDRLMVNVRRLVRHDMMVLSLLATVVGVGTGGAIIVFREAIGLGQTLFMGSDIEALWISGEGLPWWRKLLAPTLGGLIVGLMIHHLMPGRRPHGVPDAIEASALQGGRMSARTGLWAAVISAVSIGAGASVGREGPAVHLGATLGSWIAEWLQMNRRLSRTLLGCGAAAAVAASFNAPIAGVLFASEVVIGHYALSALAPVVIASVMGTMVSHAYFGNFPAFALPHHEMISFWEFPAIIGLGILAGGTAILFVQAVKFNGLLASKIPGPAWVKPAIGGALVGLIAIPLPHVLSIGYGVTDASLAGSLGLHLLVAVCLAKLLATAISLGFGFGGGVFSPSLVIGVTLGGAYGIVATSIFPEYSAGASAYAVIGMGAMAAAILGAPISTTLIIFEMTGDYHITMAVMLAVIVSELIFRPLQGQSFFTWALEQRGLDLQGSFQTSLLRGVPVSQVRTMQCEVIGPEVGLGALKRMLWSSLTGQFFVVDEDGVLLGTLSLSDLDEAAYDPILDYLVYAEDVVRRSAPVLAEDDTLETALKLTRTSGETYIAVVEDLETRKFAGCLRETDALKAYNQALLINRRQEHQ